MRAHRHGAPLVVIRSEAEPGRFQLRLIGELDLGTIEVLDAQLAHTTDQSPPSTIDVSELRFLDLTGLRALQRAGQADGAPETRLVGATGVVRRIIERPTTLTPQDPWSHVGRRQASLAPRPLHSQAPGLRYGILIALCATGITLLPTAARIRRARHT